MHGGLGGATFRFKAFDRSLDVDVNYTYRYRPSRLLEEVPVPEQILFFTITMNGLLFIGK